MSSAGTLGSVSSGVSQGSGSRLWLMSHFTHALTLHMCTAHHGSMPKTCRGWNSEGKGKEIEDRGQ